MFVATHGGSRSRKLFFGWDGAIGWESESWGGGSKEGDFGSGDMERREKEFDVCNGTEWHYIAIIRSEFFSPSQR
jgi:hypothetical protein